jgi:hypothetical protein
MIENNDNLINNNNNIDNNNNNNNNNNCRAAVRERARGELRSTQNDVVGELLESVEEFAEIGETLGISSESADLMQDMNLEDRVKGLQDLLSVQSKFNQGKILQLEKF